MDVFDPAHICNHSDETGRYAYKVCYFLSKYLFLLIMKLEVSTKHDVRVHPRHQY